MRRLFGDRIESDKVYAALVKLAYGRELRVRLSLDEAARHAPLVMQYAPKEKHVSFVELLRT